MTTKQKPEYVTDIEHEPGCLDEGDRTKLYLVRSVEEVQQFEPYIENEGELLTDWGEWEFEQELGPRKLWCSGCQKWQYVATDKFDHVVTLTPDQCVNHMVHHITNWKQPCEYCGYHGEKQ